MDTAEETKSTEKSFRFEGDLSGAERGFGSKGKEKIELVK